MAKAHFISWYIRLPSTIWMGVAGLALFILAPKGARAEGSLSNSLNTLESSPSDLSSKEKGVVGHTFIKSQVKELAGKVLIDAQLEVSQPLQVDRYVNFVSVSTPTFTPSSGHSLLWLNNTAKALCTKFDNGSAACLGAGGGSSSVVWGGIGGSLPNQTDLNNMFIAVAASTAAVGVSTGSLQAQLNGLATTYLTLSSATATYLQLSSATATYLSLAVYNSSEPVTYLTQSSATLTYLKLSSAPLTYLTQSSATATYLQLSSASITYLTVSSAPVTYLTQSSATLTYPQLFTNGLVKSGASVSVSAVSLSSQVVGNLPVTNLNSGTSANSLTFWRGDGAWAAPAGTGDAILAATQTFSGADTFTSISGITASSITFVSYTAGGIRGTFAADSAATGFVGEYISSTSLQNAVAPTSTNYGDKLAIIIGPGDWDVTGVCFIDQETATWTHVEIGLSITSGNSNTGLLRGQNEDEQSFQSSSTTPTQFTLKIPPYRFSVAATTTVYLKMMATYTAGSAPTFRSARLSGRRMR